MKTKIISESNLKRLFIKKIKHASTIFVKLYINQFYR